MLCLDFVQIVRTRSSTKTQMVFRSYTYKLNYNYNYFSTKYVTSGFHPVSSDWVDNEKTRGFFLSNTHKLNQNYYFRTKNMLHPDFICSVRTESTMTKHTVFRQYTRKLNQNHYFRTKYIVSEFHSVCLN